MTNTTPTVASVEAGADASVEQHLHRFYVELQAWIDDGARHHMIFRADTGLCRNIVSWCLLNGIATSSLVRALSEEFTAAGLNALFPFNAARHDYFVERENSSLYANFARLAWIKARALSQPVGSEG